MQLYTAWRDISVRKQAEDAVRESEEIYKTSYAIARRNSLTDSLTGLPNRRQFDNVLQTEFS